MASLGKLFLCFLSVERLWFYVCCWETKGYLLVLQFVDNEGMLIVTKSLIPNNSKTSHNFPRPGGGGYKKYLWWVIWWEVVTRNTWFYRLSLVASYWRIRVTRNTLWTRLILISAQYFWWVRLRRPKGLVHISKIPTHWPPPSKNLAAE